MVQSALNLSHMTREPKSLAERIAAELPTPSGAVPNALDPPPEEHTVSSMAERFAPEPPKPAHETLRRPMIDPFAKPRAMEPRSAFSGRGLLAALFFVSLLPAMLLMALVWYGGLKLPAPPHAASVKQATAAKEAMPKEATTAKEPVAAKSALQTEPAPVPAPAPAAPSHQAASLAGAAPQSAPPAELEVTLSAPVSLQTEPGQDVAFPIEIDASGPLPARSFLAVRAMPEGAALSKGRPYGDAEWSISPDELADLSLRMPETARGDTSLRIELVAPDGDILATAVTRLVAPPDEPKSALIVRADERGRIDGLIEHGQKMIDVGYFAGARAYFQRAAEAGSGEAALALGATYDPAFIEALQAHGIKADPDSAERWYMRASELGVIDQEAKLAALKEDWANPPHHEAQPAAEAEAKPAVASATPEGGTEAASDGNALTRLIAATGLGSGGEWVEVAGAVNVRQSPSATGETLRVAQKGTKLRVMSREGNWVQVSDPSTSETGWIYARFVETSSAP